ncbi:hypothetical protein B566_EDAN008485 [Ephemera danica]|nr:hypothetical protein B566_EDAN008485 [Ephemera danica]
MFSKSTHRKYWYFARESEVSTLKRSSYNNFIDMHGLDFINSKKEEYILTFAEEMKLLKRYDLKLQQFCLSSKPPMSDTVISMASHYFKRFYLLNSVMEYPPSDIMLTCIYVACKMDSASTKMKKFLKNITEDKERTAKAICNYEFLVMKKINFSLIVHCPFMLIESILEQFEVRHF